ncbi:hypothetical protein ACM26W_00255 [Halomonas sp. HK25]|uniref:hypothetical protein n=1 Tax=Halomonas sp. HK25 TaxID=3394321 RepID=UPI0039FC0C41
MHKSRDSFPPRYSASRMRRRAYLLAALALALGLGLMNSWSSQQLMPQAPAQALSPVPQPSFGIGDLFRH